MMESAAGLNMHPIHFILINKMKSRLVALVVVLFLGASAFALTNGSIVISGIVPQSVYLSVSSNQINLRANQDSESPVSVTMLTVWSSGHWAISVESKNTGYLLNPSDPQARLRYLFTLGILTQEPQGLGSPWTSEVQSSTSKAGLALPLSILLQTGGQMIGEGLYEDLLTINIKQF
jgi:hypothetical protein